MGKQQQQKPKKTKKRCFQKTETDTQRKPRDWRGTSKPSSTKGGHDTRSLAVSLPAAEGNSRLSPVTPASRAVALSHPVSDDLLRPLGNGHRLHVSFAIYGCICVFVK
jgi:hypothetical protein